MAGDFLERENPQDDRFLIALFNGRLYKSSSLTLPESLQARSPLLAYWGQLLQPEEGKISIPGGTLFYRAEPIELGGEIQGVLVAANIIDSSRDRLGIAAMPSAPITATALIVAVLIFIAWIAARSLLTRMRSLLKTARLLADSDLTQRIPVRGRGDMAELTRTFNEMLDRAEAAVRERQNFIKYASHELRTPITIVRGHLELLGTDPAEQQETVALVLDELDRMSCLVNDMAVLAKAERPDLLDLETVEIGSLTEELYAKARTLGARRWRLEARGSGKIALDKGRLTQAIANLVENATHYTTEKDAIALGSAVREDAVYFWVSDSGEGIPEAEQERIFEGGVRGKSAKLRREGSGLGLSIVKAIALAHGGRVELKSQPGRGSIFTLVIPRVGIANPEPQSAIDVERQIEPEPERYVPIPKPALARQHYGSGSQQRPLFQGFDLAIASHPSAKATIKSGLTHT